MAAVRTIFWRQVTALVLILLVFVGIPLYTSTDSFMTWLYEKARRDGWSNAPRITSACAEYYQWTGRNRRAVEVFELFLTRWPDDPRAPESLLYGAGAIQATMWEMGKEPQSAGRDARIVAAREKAILWLETLAAKYPAHTYAERALLSAEVMRKEVR